MNYVTLKKDVEVMIEQQKEAYQAFGRILYVYKTENTSIRRRLDGRVLLGKD